MSLRTIVAVLFFFVFLSDLSFSFAQTNNSSQTQSLAPVGYPDSNGTPSVCMMYHFGSDPNDPLWPDSISGLVEAKDGTIYGAASNGACAACHGRVFKMTPDGKFSIVHVFDGIEGDGPIGGLAKGPGDTFYGTTYGGGIVEYTYNGKHYTKRTGTGTIYSVSAGGGGISPIWSFRNNWLRRIGKDDPPHTEKEIKDAPASYPVSPPVTNKAGKTMGVTSYAWNNRFGALYSLDGGYETVENMDGSKAHKLISLSPGVVDNNFYGTSTYGSKEDKKGALFGTVFMTSGGPIKVLHQFNGDDGATPWNVIQGKDGKLYGATYAGGMYKRRYGVIYRLNSDGSGFEVLHHLNGTEGSQAASALVWGTDNRLYGSARYGGGNHGTLFRIDPDGGNFTVLHNFRMYQTGKSPLGNMIQHSNKYFYGTTYMGGKHNSGGIFRLDAGLAGVTGTIPIVSRVCCSLGQSDNVHNIYKSNPIRTGGPIHPSETLGHHSGQGWDNVGYVYTLKAGLIDLGHLRWMIDTVKHTYDILMQTPRNELPTIYLPDGEAYIKKKPATEEEMIKLAGAIAYVQGWAHELITWNLFIHNWSSFSPEDLVSNVVGVMIGQRAIRNHCALNFDQAVDIEMFEMMKELQAQPRTRTKDVIDSVERDNFHAHSHGKWFTMLFGYEYLVRRNFEVWPWLVPYEYPRLRPGWLTDVQYKMYYPYFDFEINKPVDGEVGVRLAEMQSVTDKIRRNWVNNERGIDHWEAPPRGFVEEGPPDGVPGWPEGK